MKPGSLSAMALALTLLTAPVMAQTPAPDDDTTAQIQRLPDSEQTGSGIMTMPDPAQSMMSMHAQMNRMFEDFFNRSDMPMMGLPQQTMGGVFNYPAADIVEEAADYKVTFELPGIDPDSVDLVVSRNYLTVKSEKQQQTQTQDKNYVQRETSFGSFERSINLPNAADTEHADAVYKNGVLTVTFPKKANAEPETHKLKIRKEG